MEEKVEPIPDLGSQLDNIITFISELSWKEAKIDQMIGALPIGPPRCEMSKRRIKFNSFEDPSRIFNSIPHRNYQGKETSNARVCPHCDAVLYSNAALNQIVSCFSCGGVFKWMP